MTNEIPSPNVQGKSFVISSSSFQ